MIDFKTVGNGNIMMARAIRPLKKRTPAIILVMILEAVRLKCGIKEIMWMTEALII